MERIEPIRVIFDEETGIEYHQITYNIAVSVPMYRPTLTITGPDGLEYSRQGDWKPRRTSRAAIDFVHIHSSYGRVAISRGDLFDPFGADYARALAADLQRAAAYLEQWEAEHV